MKTAIATCLAASILYTSDCVAASNIKLPVDVRPLTKQETISIYSDKTINYGGFSYYFGPDGYLVGVTKNGRSFGQGTWAVDDNTICLQASWRSSGTSKSFRYHVCYAWYANATAYWTKITKGGLSGSVYQGDPSIAAAGDQVSELAAKVKEGHRHYVPHVSQVGVFSAAKTQ